MSMGGGGGGGGGGGHERTSCSGSTAHSISMANVS